MGHWYTEELVKGMPHWQSPPWLTARDSFDPSRMIELYREAGIRVITPHAKHVDGFCFYASRFATARKDARDYLGELVREAKKSGIRVVPYYMIVVDGMAAGEHPDWSCLNADGTVKEGFGSIFCCINHPGYRGYVLNQIREIMENYEVDGIWSDSLNWPDDGCFCASCRSLFGRQYGLNLAAAKGKPAARRFYNECWAALAADVHAIVAAKRSDAIFLFNGGGLHTHNQSVERYAAVNSCEAHAALHASERGRRLRRLDKPFEICYITEKDWGGFAYNTEDEVKLIASEAVAHGGMVMLSTHVTPQGRLLETGMAMVAGANDHIRRIRPYVDDAAPVYDVGVIWPGPEEAKMGLALMQFDIPYCYTDTKQDWSDLRLVYSQSFVRKQKAHAVKDDVDEDVQDETMPGHIDAEVADKIRRYVAAGGIYVMEVPHAGAHADGGIDFAIADVLGVSYGGNTPYEGHYVQAVDPALGEGLPPDLPLLVPGGGCRIHNRTAEVWANLVYPLKPLNSLYKMQKRITNAPDGASPTAPAVTVHRFGAGFGVCVAVPLSQSVMPNMFGKGHPYHYWPRKWLANLMFRLLSDPLLLPVSPLGVEVVVNAQPARRRHVVHLFNHYGLKGVPVKRDSSYEPNPQTVALADVRIAINLDRIGPVNDVKPALTGQSLTIARNGNWLYVTIPKLEQQEIILLEA